MAAQSKMIWKQFLRLLGWCCVGTVALPLLYFVVDGFVMGFTSKSLDLNFNPFYEQHRSTFHDTLAWDFLVYLFVSVVGAIAGIVFGMARWIIARRRSRL